MKQILTILFSFSLFVLNAQEPPVKHSPNGFFDKVFDMYGKEYTLEECE